MSSFGGTVKLTGESEYKKALSEINSNLKVLGSEMKAVSSQYDKNDTSAEKLNATNKVATKQIEEQEKKVNLLKEALAKSKTETGETSEATKKWQIQLNNAQADLNNMKNSVKAYGDETAEAGENTLKLGDIIKANLITDAIKTGLSALATGMKAIGEGVVGVVKQSVASYGEYEQLVGGVETLFGDSASKVMEYANNAYKTSGLSANAYMETVTSFSASMIQSLGGDTEKAAEMSNMALQDMSDNANKMGTDMASIQHAYQGFAKQNYTMLDNLKLGYGGNKTEMQRLLDDATKLSGIKYDISSYSDIVSAIHVVQTEMGIAGTTQLEAAGTITGSIGSLKSAWQNLITGLGDADANFEQLCGNIVDNALGVVNNMIPVINNVISTLPTVIQKILDAVAENLPQLLETGKGLLTTLVNGISDNMDSIMSVVMDIVNTLVSTIVENLPMIIKIGIQMLVALVNGIADSLPQLIPTIVDAVILICETLLDNIDLIIDAGINIIMGLTEGLINASPKLIDKIPVIIDKLIMAITNNLPKIIEMGIQLTVQLAVGLIKAIPQLVAKIPQIISSIVSGFANYYSKIGEVGTNLIKGLWNGIKDAGAWLRDKISGFFDGVVDSIKDFFGIHSPSTLFRDDIGKNLALGIGEGFSGEMQNISDEMQSAIPTEFDTSVNASYNGAVSQYEMYVSAFKQALTDVKVVLNDREMGTFVTDTVGRAVYGY